MAQHRVKQDVDWSHFYVYHDNKPTQYDQFIPTEFAYGYACMMESCTLTASDVQTLQQHFKQLMEDATSYKWEVVCNFHGVLLNMLHGDQYPGME